MKRALSARFAGPRLTATTPPHRALLAELDELAEGRERWFFLDGGLS